VAKRLFDIFFAALLLILFAPVMVLVALAIRVTMGPPVLFKQKRPGKNGTIFTIYKFRTMREAVNEKGEPLPDMQRLTPLGKVLRATSLDELPQLFNVLKGDMSFVGPRPLLPEYLPLYNARQRRRHEVRPGITGWAQVNGRNALNWEERFEMDVWYVEHRTFRLDMKILWLTLVKVLRHEDVNYNEKVTMEKFKGNET